MPFVEHDEVVEAFPADGADDALGERILPRRMRGDENLANAHMREAALEDLAIDRVAIAEEVLRGGVVGERLDDLLRDPRGRWVVGDVDVKEFSTIVAEHDEGEEQPEGESRDDEEVDGHEFAEMGVKEGAPRWGRPKWPAHVFGDGQSGNVVAQESEFGLDPTAAPGGVLPGHTPDQISDREVDRRATH